MDPLEWLALLAIFGVSFIQFFVFYIHSYATRDGWTTNFDHFKNENLKLLAIPDAVFLGYFLIMILLRSLAFFLAWIVLYRFLVFEVFSSDAESTMSVLGACFVLNIFFTISWTQSFCSPPQPNFTRAFIFALLDFAIVILSLVYYYDFITGIHEPIGPFSIETEKNYGPFLSQIFYFVFYTIVILVGSFFGVFYSTIKSP